MRPKTDRRPLSLRQRLILALMTPLIAILAVSSVFDYQLAKRTANRAHDQALADNVYDLAAHLIRQLPSKDLDLEGESEAMLRSNAPDVLYFSVTDDTGKLVAGDADLPLLSPPAGDQIVFSDGFYHGQPVRMAAHRIGPSRQGFLIVVVETTAKRRQASNRLLTAMIVPNLAVVLATILAVLFGVRQGLLPLNTVERDIAGRSANDLHEIALADAPAEIRPMLARLNELFALVRKSVDVQQRFIADAAHQLRTPLAGLQTQLDLAQAEGVFRNSPERFQAIDEASARMGHLLSQLLTYARAETSATLTERFADVDLGQLVENSASRFLDAALAKHIDLGFDIQPAKTTGFPWMLQEALSNLIDNALRYTRPGGVVTVQCGSENGRPYLGVEDNGPGIPEEHGRQVFERFYRIPGSPGNGCGLGLAIVQEIAELHGATVLFLNVPHGGLHVRIDFPARAGA